MITNYLNHFDEYRHLIDHFVTEYGGDKFSLGMSQSAYFDTPSGDPHLVVKFETRRGYTLEFNPKAPRDNIREYLDYKRNIALQLRVML